MNWAEQLPKGCPPNDAFPPDQESPFYRLIEGSEPTAIDFHSHRMRWPDMNFNAEECIARAVSIHNNIDSCKKVRKYPTQKNKKMIKIILSEKSGVIKRQGRSGGHFSWWRTKEFNALECCEVLED